VIGFILGIVGAATLNSTSGYDAPYSVEAASYAILIILTFVEFWTMVLGYYAIMRQNMQNLKYFRVWIVVWIVVDVVLLILSYGGLFLLLLIPLGISIFLSERARRIGNLMFGEIHM